MGRFIKLIKALDLSEKDTAYIFGSVNIGSPDKIHDWRNYAQEFKDIWDDMTEPEKAIVYYFAEKLADREEWE